MFTSNPRQPIVKLLLEVYVTTGMNSKQKPKKQQVIKKLSLSTKQAFFILKIMFTIHVEIKVQHKNVPVFFIQPMYLLQGPSCPPLQIK